LVQRPRRWTKRRLASFSGTVLARIGSCVQCAVPLLHGVSVNPPLSYRALHCSSDVVHFAAAPDLVVVDPKFLCDIVAVMLAPTKFKQHAARSADGFLTLAALAESVGWPMEKMQPVVTILQEMGMCVDVGSQGGGDHRVLFPALLESAEAAAGGAAGWEPGASSITCGLRLHCASFVDQLPAGLMPRLQVKGKSGWCLWPKPQCLTSSCHLRQSHRDLSRPVPPPLLASQCALYTEMPSTREAPAKMAIQLFAGGLSISTPLPHMVCQLTGRARAMDAWVHGNDRAECAALMTAFESCLERIRSETCAGLELEALVLSRVQLRAFGDDRDPGSVEGVALHTVCSKPGAEIVTVGRDDPHKEMVGDLWLGKGDADGKRMNG